MMKKVSICYNIQIKTCSHAKPKFLPKMITSKLIQFPSMKNLWNITIHIPLIVLKKHKFLTGFLMLNWHGNLLRMAGSMSLGRFVAATIMMRQLGSVMIPSHILMNWALIIAVASWSWELLDRKKESTNVVSKNNCKPVVSSLWECQETWTEAKQRSHDPKPWNNT